MFLLLYVTVYILHVHDDDCDLDIQQVSDIILLSLIVVGTPSFNKTNASNYVSFTLCDCVYYMYIMMIVIWIFST